MNHASTRVHCKSRKKQYSGIHGLYEGIDRSYTRNVSSKANSNCARVCAIDALCVVPSQVEYITDVEQFLRETWPCENIETTRFESLARALCNEKRNSFFSLKVLKTFVQRNRAQKSEEGSCRLLRSLQVAVTVSWVAIEPAFVNLQDILEVTSIPPSVDTVDMSDVSLLRMWAQKCMGVYPQHTNIQRLSGRFLARALVLDVDTPSFSAYVARQQDAGTDGYPRVHSFFSAASTYFEQQIQKELIDTDYLDDTLTGDQLVTLQATHLRHRHGKPIETPAWSYMRIALTTLWNNTKTWAEYCKVFRLLRSRSLRISRRIACTVGYLPEFGTEPSVSSEGTVPRYAGVSPKIASRLQRNIEQYTRDTCILNLARVPVLQRRRTVLPIAVFVDVCFTSCLRMLTNDTRILPWFSAHSRCAVVVHDLFLEACKANSTWTLFSPESAAALVDLCGSSFEKAYVPLTATQGKHSRTVVMPAREVLRLICAFKLQHETLLVYNVDCTDNIPEELTHAQQLLLHPWWQARENDAKDTRAYAFPSAYADTRDVCVEHVSVDTLVGVANPTVETDRPPQHPSVDSLQIHLLVSNYIIQTQSPHDHRVALRTFDWVGFNHASKMAVWVMDRVLDVVPALGAQEGVRIKARRAFGLSFSGIRDALATLEWTWGSAAGIQFVSRVCETIAHATAYQNAECAGTACRVYKKEEKRHNTNMAALKQDLEVACEDHMLELVESCKRCVNARESSLTHVEVLEKIDTVVAVRDDLEAKRLEWKNRFSGPLGFEGAYPDFHPHTQTETTGARHVAGFWEHLYPCEEHDGTSFKNKPPGVTQSCDWSEVQGRVIRYGLRNQITISRGDLDGQHGVHTHTSCLDGPNMVFPPPRTNTNTVSVENANTNSSYACAIDYMYEIGVNIQHTVDVLAQNGCRVTEWIEVPTWNPTQETVLLQVPLRALDPRIVELFPGNFDLSIQSSVAWENIFVYWFGKYATSAICIPLESITEEITLEKTLLHYALYRYELKIPTVLSCVYTVFADCSLFAKNSVSPSKTLPATLPRSQLQTI